MAWARTYLKKNGAIDNLSRGVWAINGDYLTIEKFDVKEVVKTVCAMDLKNNKENIKLFDNDIKNHGVNHRKN